MRDHDPAIWPGIPGRRPPAARYFAALPIRNWGCGARCLCVDRSTLRRRPKLVAGSAAGAYGIRELSLPSVVIFRRKLAADQSRCVDRGGALTGERLRSEERRV